MTEPIARVALSAATYAIDKPYSYRVPEEAAAFLQPGMRVVVPFGAGDRRVEGLVLALSAEEPAAGRRLKQILTVLDEAPVLDEEGIRRSMMEF